ncbi:MAG TPA: HAD family hydrolase [Dongiaceae bacterium]|nr:HAD family hydrolase [Dongiaceae bacterium]
MSFAEAVAFTEPKTLPRAVLFDWDNTLVDSWAVIHAALNHTLAAMGHETWSRAETEMRARASLRDSFPTLFGDDWQQAEKLFYDHFSAIHLSYLAPLPGVTELLEYLAGLPIYLAVVSNKRGVFLRKEASHLGWDRYFAVLAGAGDAARDKPARDHVELALGGPSGLVAGADVWFIGDTDIDLRCAHLAGCTPVLIRTTAPAAGEFDPHPPALYHPDCQSLLAYLQSL